MPMKSRGSKPSKVQRKKESKLLNPRKNNQSYLQKLCIPTILSQWGARNFTLRWQTSDNCWCERNWQIFRFQIDFKWCWMIANRVIVILWCFFYKIWSGPMIYWSFIISKIWTQKATWRLFCKIAFGNCVLEKTKKSHFRRLFRPIVKVFISQNRLVASDFRRLWRLWRPR